MKLLKYDWKKGFATIKAEHPDDLWHLDLIIDPQDQIRSSTERKIKIGDASTDRNIKIIKKQVKLTLLIEKTQLTGDTLRISGTIQEGPDDLPLGAHHTIALEVGQIASITKKEWKQYQIKRIEKACKEVKHTYLIVLFDREEAIIAKLTASGYSILTKEHGEVAKKTDLTTTQSNFYTQLSKLIDNLVTTHKIERVILASPHFWSKYLQEALPEHLKKISISASCSTVSESSIQEVLKRPELTQLLKDERSAEEERIVEKLMEALAKDKAGYGKEEVAKLVAEGNTSFVCITDASIRAWREDESFGEVEKTLLAAEKNQSRVHILSSPELVKKIDSLGGIACLKRW